MPLQSDNASDAQLTDDEKKRELDRLLKLQRLSFIRSLKSLIWALITEVATELCLNDTYEEKNEIELRFVDLGIPVVVVVQTVLSELVGEEVELSAEPLNSEAEKYSDQTNIT